MVKFFISIITLLTLAFLAAPGQEDFRQTISFLDSPASIPREHSLDITRMSLDVHFEPYNGLVKGRVRHVFKVLQKKVDSVVLDAMKINVLQALVGGKPTRYTNTDSTIIVYFEPALVWDQVDSIDFRYEVTPRKGLYFIGWSDSTSTREKQIWTQGQAQDHRYWIPMYDNLNDKMLTEATITFDSTYTVISNGERLPSTVNGDGTKTWRYRMHMPHSSYLVMLAIGKYNVTNRVSSSGIPIELYSYPQNPSAIIPTYVHTERAFDFLERTIGIPYQWSVYRQIPVADYVFGAMENTTATIFGDFFLTDARGALNRSYLNVNVHELTHQWFGDLVTARSPRDHWLQESFATFYPLLFAEHLQGPDEYQWSLRGMQNAALEAGKRDRFPVVHPQAGGSRVYQKGAAVLDMMRYVFGAEELNRVIRHYLKHHAFENVETNDLYISFQDTLGISPKWFFDQWLYRGGEPHYKITYKTGEVSTPEGSQSVTFVDVEQIQNTDDLTGYFEMPVVVEVHYGNGSKDSVRALVKGARTIVEIPNTNDKKPSFVLFDPSSHILKHVTFVRTPEELVAQARKAPFMIDRNDALQALFEDSTSKQIALSVALDAMSGEPYYGIRLTAVGLASSALNLHADQAWQIIERGLVDRSALVRKAALNAITNVPERLKAAIVSMLQDSSYQIIQGALMVLCTSFPNETSSFTDMVKTIKSPEAYVEITALEMKANRGESGAVDSIAEYGSNRYEFGTRRNAFRALTRIGMLTEKAVVNLLDAAQNPNERLAGAALQAMGTLSEQTRWKELLRRTVGQRKFVGSSNQLEKLIR